MGYHIFLQVEIPCIPILFAVGALDKPCRSALGRGAVATALPSDAPAHGSNRYLQAACVKLFVRECLGRFVPLAFWPIALDRLESNAPGSSLSTVAWARPRRLDFSHWRCPCTSLHLDLVARPNLQNA
jgi:hypothetical protein